MIEPSLIEDLEIFRGASPAARRVLAGGAVRRRYGAGETLWTAGSAPRGLFTVLEGEVRILRGGGGRQHVVHVERAGGTLGEIPLFDGGLLPATAVASAPTECIIVDGDTLRAAIEIDPTLALRFLARLAARVRHLVDRLDRLAMLDVTSRLATMVLARYEAAGGESFGLGTSHAAIAEEIGTVREVIVRGLRRLRAERVIGSAGRGRYRVLDRRRLETLATGGERG